MLQAWCLVLGFRGERVGVGVWGYRMSDLFFSGAWFEEEMGHRRSVVVTFWWCTGQQHLLTYSASLIPLR